MTEYATVRLSVDAAEATTIIHETVKGLRESETDEEITFRTLEGRQVAVLAPDGDGSTLTYRTDPSLAVRGDVTRKAQKIRHAVDEYTVREN